MRFYSAHLDGIPLNRCCSLAGPPITNETAVSVLLKHGVTVALGVEEGWQPVNTRFDAGWVSEFVLVIMSTKV